MSGKTYTMPQFIEALKRMENNVRGKVFANAAMAGGRVIEAQAKINVVNTFKHITGALANSIQTTLESSSADQAVVAVGPTVIYGRIQELGGTIKPLTAKKLHWVNENGEHRSAYEVTLPARPYMKPAVEDHQADIIQAVSENLRIEIEGAI